MMRIGRIDVLTGVNERDDREQKLWKPDKHDGRNGDVERCLAAGIFKNIESVALDNIICS
jgi:hypothetical protein